MPRPYVAAQGRETQGDLTMERYAVNIEVEWQEVDDEGDIVDASSDFTTEVERWFDTRDAAIDFARRLANHGDQLDA